MNKSLTGCGEWPCLDSPTFLNLVDTNSSCKSVFKDIKERFHELLRRRVHDKLTELLKRSNTEAHGLVSGRPR